MLIDKVKAIRNSWRIRERTLFIVALIGGSLGCVAGMYLFRHKTKKPVFTILMPAIVCLHTIILIYIIK